MVSNTSFLYEMSHRPGSLLKDWLVANEWLRRERKAMRRPLTNPPAKLLCAVHVLTFRVMPRVVALDPDNHSDRPFSSPFPVGAFSPVPGTPCGFFRRLTIIC